MNIAIAGAGIAGGYLSGLLEKRGISADIYDGMDHHTRCGSRSCGWGVPTAIGKYLADVDLNLEDYLIEPMATMNFDGLTAETPLCTLDKPRLLRDLTGGASLRRKNLEPDDALDYEIVVDATGIQRAFLPPCRSDLTLPTIQQRVTVESRGNERLGAGVYGNQVPGLGYLWIFPLRNGLYHIGVGGIGLSRLSDLLEQFYRESSDAFSFTSLCSCEGSVRVASPYYSTPFFIRKSCNGRGRQLIIGIGESIGTVSPFTGEGILFSLECTRLFVDSWLNPEAYTQSVLDRFSWMKRERETLDYLLSAPGRARPRLRDRWRFFLNARRSGISLPMLEAFKRMGTLTKWVDGIEK
jgi:flavin-dependent dehydrogenase